MGIILWLKTRFVLKSPPILKVKVLNFKLIKVTCFAVKNPRISGSQRSGIPV